MKLREWPLPPLDVQVAVRAVNPLLEAGWDAHVECWPGASFFHSRAWAKVLHETYGFKPAYLVADHDGHDIGILPLMEVDSWLTGRRGASLPFTDECEPLVRDTRALAALTEAALSCAHLRRWKYLELRGGRNHFGAPASLRYYGHTLALHDEIKQLFADCDSAVRRAVRKAAASDIQIEFRRSAEAAGTFHRLLCQTRQRHGVPPQPLRFFQQLHEHVLARNQGWIVLATLGGRAIAGAVFVHFGSSALYKYGASDETFQELRPNNLVMWRAIEWHARAGFTTLDFGRTDMHNAGLRRFKLAWGTRERVIEYVRYNCRANQFATLPPRASDQLQRVFKILPKPLLRLIGAAAYRHVG